jgi:hypothetical protein
VRWTVPGPDTAFAAATTCATSVPVDVTVSPGQSLRLVLDLASRAFLDGSGDPVTRVALLAVNDADATTSSSPIPVPAMVSSAPFCNPDWVVQVHKNQQYVTVTRRQALADITTLPSLALVVGSYLPAGVTATIVLLTTTAAGCVYEPEEVEVALPATVEECVPCCEAAFEDGRAGALGIQAASLRYLPSGCPPCGWPSVCGTRPLPLAKAVALGTYHVTGACPPARCCRKVVPVTPCVPGQVFTQTDYYMFASLGAPCGGGWFFPRTEPGPVGSPVVLDTAAGAASTVSFTVPAGDVVPVSQSLPVAMNVFGNPVAWRRFSTPVLGYVGEYQLNYYVLTWGVFASNLTVDTILLTSVVSGTSCEGDPYAGCCDGVTTMRLADLSHLVCQASPDPDQPATYMMFLTTQAVSLLGLPAGSVVFCCYNDLMLSKLNVTAFQPVTWCLQPNPDLSSLMAMAPSC